MDKYKELLRTSLINKYYTNEDLRMNKKYGFMLSRAQLEEYLDFKDSDTSKFKVELNLKTFNSKKIYYYKSKELLSLLNDYLLFFMNDMKNNNSTIISENYSEMLISRLASELEGTLKIESVNTTRKKIISIIEENKVNDKNEQIIFNMYEGYKFISQKPSFNKDNMLKLYKILSDKSLKDEDEIKGYYREEMVEIGGHDGCPVEKIEECMESLFNYVNEHINDRELLLLPFIVHYYILYIHPYMDFNGRTARMTSLWISILMGKEEILPMYISEAINDDKNNYYKAINNSRFSHNDLTYFLTYLIKLSNSYYLVYKNIVSIKEELALIGESITLTETYYLKRIIVNSKKGWFNYKGFINFCNLDISKQGALKILNNLLKLNLLKSKINSKNEKIFILNEDVLKYSISND